MEEIQKHGIRLYDFPDCDQDEDEDFRNLTKQLKVISLSVCMCQNIEFSSNRPRISEVAIISLMSSDSF